MSVDIYSPYAAWSFDLGYMLLPQVFDELAEAIRFFAVLATISMASI
jgi:hypothetical protein